METDKGEDHFAADQAEKNRTQLFLYDDLTDHSAAEFVIVRPNCRHRIAVRRANRQVAATATV